MHQKGQNNDAPKHEITDFNKNHLEISSKRIINKDRRPGKEIT